MNYIDKIIYKINKNIKFRKLNKINIMIYNNENILMILKKNK